MNVIAIDPHYCHQHGVFHLTRTSRPLPPPTIPLVVDPHETASYASTGTFFSVLDKVRAKTQVMNHLNENLYTVEG